MEKMEMVEVVIRIPKNTYDAIVSLKNAHPDCLMTQFPKAIANGTVLPKGHGKLIDADEAIDAIINSNDWIGNKNENIKMIEGLPTVIEAYKDGDTNGKANSNS